MLPAPQGLVCHSTTATLRRGLCWAKLCPVCSQSVNCLVQLGLIKGGGMGSKGLPEEALVLLGPGDISCFKAVSAV